MTRNRRAGLTLIEVLVSMFIMGVGLLAIMTLFPLGALNMARAVRDDRSYHAAVCADGLFRAYWNAEIIDRVVTDKVPVTLILNNDPVFKALDDPGSGLTPLAAGELGPSYPVVVDPWGYAGRPPPSRDLIGSNSSTLVPRRPLPASVLPNNQNLFAAISLKDTMGFDEDGHPTADREYRYNWMWIIQRPVNRERFTATMTVVVFDDRPFLFASPESEIVRDVQFNPNSTTVFVPDPALAVRPGGWVMDATVNPPGVTAAVRPLRHANVYRVVSVIPDVNGVTLELQTPIKTPSDNDATRGYPGKLVVLNGVSGVFTRKMLGTAE